MRCEVLAIGTELLLGQIVDTNSTWIGEQLAAVVAGGVDALFGGAARQSLILAAHEHFGNGLGPLAIHPTAQRATDIHGEAAAGDERDTLLAFPGIDKPAHHPPQRDAACRQR